MAIEHTNEVYLYETLLPYPLIKHAAGMQVDIDFLREGCTVIVPTSGYLELGDQMIIVVDVERTGTFFWPITLNADHVKSGVTWDMELFTGLVYERSKVEVYYTLQTAGLRSPTQPYVVAHL